MNFEFQGEAQLMMNFVGTDEKKTNVIHAKLQSVYNAVWMIHKLLLQPFFLFLRGDESSPMSHHLVTTNGIILLKHHYCTRQFDQG